MLYIASVILIPRLVAVSIMCGKFFGHTISLSAYLGTHAEFVPYFSGIYISMPSGAHDYSAYSTVDCMLY